MNRLFASVLAALAVLVCCVGVASATPTSWTIHISKIGVNVQVQDSVDSASLAVGPGFYNRIRPNWRVTVAIAGHHMTHTHPFLKIDQLRLGDSIVLRKGATRYRYRVVRHMRLPGDRQVDKMFGDMNEDKLVLTTCNEGASYRWIVQAIPQYIWAKRHNKPKSNGAQTASAQPGPHH